MSKRKWGMKDAKPGMVVDVRANFGHGHVGGEELKVTEKYEDGKWWIEGLKNDWGGYNPTKPGHCWAKEEDMRPHIPRKQPKRDAAGKFAKKDEPLTVGDLVDYVGTDSQVTPFVGFPVTEIVQGWATVSYVLWDGKEEKRGTHIEIEHLRRSSLVEGTPEWAEAVGKQGLRVAGDEFINDNWLTFENGMWRTRFYPNVTGPLKCVGVKTWRIVGRHVKDEEKQGSYEQKAFNGETERLRASAGMLGDNLSPGPAAETNPHTVGSRSCPGYVVDLKPMFEREAIKVLEQERDMHRHCECEQKKKADALDAAIKAMKGGAR